MKRLISALAAASMIAVMATSVALATHTAQGVNHSTVAGNINCSVGTVLVKVDPVADGIYGGGAIEIYDNDGTSFSWRITDAFLNVVDANVVLVKGGPNTEVYSYPDGAGGLNFYDWDEGLTAPVNPNNGKTYGLSHVSFCFDPKVAPAS
jgi:hypothetical protein